VRCVYAFDPLPGLPQLTSTIGGGVISLWVANKMFILTLYSPSPREAPCKGFRDDRMGVPEGMLTLRVRCRERPGWGSYSKKKNRVTLPERGEAAQSAWHPGVARLRRPSRPGPNGVSKASERAEYFIKNNRDDNFRHPCNLLLAVWQS
jgi:hypothetical protein